MAVALDLTASCSGTVTDHSFAIDNASIVDVSDYDAVDALIHVTLFSCSADPLPEEPLVVSLVTGMSKPVSSAWASIATVELTYGEEIPHVELAAGCGLLKYLGWRVRGLANGATVTFSIGGMLRELGR